MSHLKIIPVDPPGKGIEIAEADSALTFQLAQQLRSAVVDVVRDDHYAFSLCRLHGDQGFWAIFQRPGQTLERLQDLAQRRRHRRSGEDRDGSLDLTRAPI